MLVNYTPNPEDLITKIASISHASKIENVPEFIQKLLNWKHFSPFEHAILTFKVNMTRVASHQMVRHRIGVSIIQQSQRYTETSSAIYPKSFDKELIKVSDDIMAHYLRVKEELSNKGYKDEDIRYFAPQNSKTSMYITFNYRSFIHFCELRLDKHAQTEIRIIANLMLDSIKEIAPTIYKYIDHHYRK